MRQYFILNHAKARNNAIEAICNAPVGYHVEIKPSTRNLEQNAMLHAILQRVSALKEWAGAKRDVETWKRLLTAAWIRARGEAIELLPAIDGHGVDLIFRKTSTLSKSEMSELIEYIIAWCIEEGIDIDE